MHILGLPTDIFNVYPATIKFKTYQARWQIGDIYVSGDARKTEDNPQGLGCYLVMTGRGCDDIFRILDSRNCTLEICSDVVSEDTDWITSILQDLILPLMIRTKSHSLP